MIGLRPRPEQLTSQSKVEGSGLWSGFESLYKTWTHDNGKLWLRDFLPEEQPSARIFTFGYNADFAFSQENYDINTFARELINNIATERSQTDVCIVIFVGKRITRM